MGQQKFQKRIAQREKVKLMVAFSGPSGSGKTYSALQLAYGITGDWTKITLADTENESALYYAGEQTGPWEHINFHADIPLAYHPNNWIELVDFVEQDKNCEVLILDSITHEWEGQGGCLEMVSAIDKGFSGWKTVSPLHNKFIDKIRHSRLHILACMRSKQDYVLEPNEKGKMAPRKIGLKSVQREGTDYEFGVVFDINMNHFATTSKDRTGLFKDTTFRIGADTGKQLMQWASAGNDPLYIATDREKIQFAEICKSLGVTDKGKMATYSEQLQHKVKLSDLEEEIKKLAGYEATPAEEISQ